MRSTKMSVRGGFTLIELLIVVAIIAILAAIAVPNFLSAQTRSKVSRAKADMKSIVTGIESYMVDNNHYPTYHYADFGGASALEFHIGGVVPAWGQPDPNWKGQNPITTPISYLTSMPQDPFAAHRDGPAEVREYLYVNWDYALQQSPPPHLVPAFNFARYRYGSYRLHSRGPDREGPDTGLPYDPTNGTVSLGDITYGPGSGFDHFIPELAATNTP